MKRTLLSLALLLWMSSSYGQYFQGLYSDYCIIGNGVSGKTTGDGQIIAGTGLTQYSYAPNVVRTDVDGNFTSPQNFNNSYNLSDRAGNPLYVTETRVLEFTDGSGYGVMGSYWVQGDGYKNYGLFYLRLDLYGNVSSIAAYEMPASIPGYSITLHSIKESSSSAGEVFATGQFVGNNEEAYVFAMRVKQNGSLVWGQVYNFITSPLIIFETAYDIIEDPYNANQVLVVGSIYYIGANFPQNGGAAQENGFCLNLDANTGAVIIMRQYDTGELDGFTGIVICNDPSQQGFMLSGYWWDDPCNSPNNNNKMMAMKADQNMNPIWANTYNTFDPGFQKTEAWGLCERRNTAGAYEYYLVGEKGVISAWDAAVLKIDAMGMPVPSGLFIYTTGNWERGVSVDINTSGTADGISMFAYHTDLYPKQNYYLVKAYFNGVSGCYESFYDAVANQLPVMVSPLPVTNVQFNQVPVRLRSVVQKNYTNLCYSQSLSDGDNSRIMPATPKDKTYKHSGAETPTLAAVENRDMQISLVAAEEQPVRITLFDMSGKMLAAYNYTAGQGNNTFHADLGGLNLAAGIYNVIVERTGQREVIKVAVR